MKPQPVRAAAAALLGTSIEWYDFYAYITAASLVFKDVFFKTENPFLSAMISMGTVAIGFIARPLGAAIFGHYGDILGRKKSLIITLVMMGTGSTLIGFLPTPASIGIAATLLLILLRFAQGVAIGGEWGGAVLISAEHSSPRWRTILASIPQYGSSFGLILSTLMFILVHRLPEAELHSWGWRIPFWGSGVLLIIAFIIRIGINESPEMLAQMAKQQHRDHMPLRTLFRDKPAALIYGIAACTLGIAGTYFATTLMINYTTMYLNVREESLLDVIFWIGFVEFTAIPLATFLAVRFGERTVLLSLSVLGILLAIPMMWLIETGDITNIAIAILGGSFLVGASYGILPAWLFHAFPVEIRYSGMSLSYQLCGAIFGGLTPMVGLALAEHTATRWLSLAGLFSALCVITFIGVWRLAVAKKPAPGNDYTQTFAQTFSE